MAHSPPGHHSVIGRPSAGGLHFPEYVVYRGEQVCKLNLIRLLNDQLLTNVFNCFYPGVSRIFGHISNNETRRQFQWQ